MTGTRKASWLALLVVLGVALFVGGRDDGGPMTEGKRARRLEAELRCPTCSGQSVAQSDAAAARAVKDEIRRRVHDGESDAEIRAFLVSRYGKDILLKPERTGVAGLVWALPVVALVCAVAGLSFAFVRWRKAAGAGPSEDDRALVERARHGG